MNFGYKRLYIDGTLTDAANGARQTHICPANDEPAGDLAWATAADAERALRAAQAAFPTWSGLPLDERAEWMARLRAAVLKRGDELRSAVMHEMGKPWAGACEDLDSLADALEFYPRAMRDVETTQLPDAGGEFQHELVARPVGVVVAILAWNFPLLNIGFKLGPALASGCTLVLKPSEKSPLSAYLLGEIAASINFPAGVLNILCGPPQEIGEALTQSRIPRLLTMIGSSAVGRKLMAQGATSIKRMSMELGGNAPVLVFADADLERAADQVAALKFGNAGQICVSPNRILVQEPVAERFTQMLAAKADAVQMGFGKESGATMGPMIDARARERVDALVKDAVHAGASLVRGGKAKDSGAGSFYEPTVLSGVRDDMRVSREEIFGPVAAVRTFATEAEALERANDTEYGLVAYAFTQDAARCERLASALDFGEIMLNGFKWGIDLPHGGVKESGIGKDCSTLALDDYLVRVRVTRRVATA